MSKVLVTRVPITHKVQARDDHPKGTGRVNWFGSINGGESYLTMEWEPQPGDHVEMASNTLPVSLAYPSGFRMCGLTLLGETRGVGVTGRGRAYTKRPGQRRRRGPWIVRWPRSTRDTHH